jgi:hypothetical protein
MASTVEIDDIVMGTAGKDFMEIWMGAHGATSAIPVG